MNFGKAWFTALGAALAMSVFAAAPAAALTVEFASRPIKRTILALYDSRQEGKPSDTRLHRLVEMPLNWLGFELTYADVNGPLPTSEEAQKYRAVVTWFMEPLNQPAAVLDWLDGATAQGLRYICFGDMAPPEPASSRATLTRLLGRLGLKPADAYVSVTLNTKLDVATPDMIGFERPVDQVLPEFRVVESASSLAQVHVAAVTPGDEVPTTSVLVATGPGGGYAADGYTIYYEPGIDRARWVLNPFRFLKLSLGDDRFPVPDVTTLAGRRMFFSHIDGDGWNNVSEIEGYRETQTSAAEVITKEVVEAYPDLPVSIGLIAGDAIPELGGLLVARKTAAKLYALPNVEVASHTTTHPFDWGFFESYSRDRELALIEKAAHPNQTAMDIARSLLLRVTGKSGAETDNRYVAGSADLPRSYLKEPFDLTSEIRRGLEVSESLAPPGKKAAIYLWSGDAEPFEAAVHATRVAGVRNMNGGDSRFDPEYPSVFYVPPISRPVGAERQIYAANSNENTYTNFWHGPFYGQLMLSQTLDNTEHPRRLKPFNLYYHMYSGEKSGSLKAIKTFTALARRTDVIPVKASEYAAIADDFFATAIEQVDASSWTIEHRGALQTVRFDDAAAIDVDLAKSAGVIGATRHEGSLYLALDPAVEPAIVVMKSAADASASPSTDARLIDSRWQLSRLVRRECGFSAEARGFGPGDMTWQAAPGQIYDVEAVRDGETLATVRETADAEGRLKLSLKADAIEPLQIAAVCHEH